jgi:hypothetical protein
VAVALWSNQGYEQITSLSAAATLTVPTNAKFCVIQAQTQDCRWRDDGTAPTASVGMVLAAGASMLYEGELSRFKIIETTTSAKVNVSYYA